MDNAELRNIICNEDALQEFYRSRFPDRKTAIPDNPFERHYALLEAWEIIKRQNPGVYDLFLINHDCPIQVIYLEACSILKKYSLKQ